ncbi:MAG: hypothetical protein AABM29_08830 [Actinomycetota bacterium]
MRLERLRSGDWLAGAGGALLLVALFLPWFGEADAWRAFDVVDVILLIAALAGVGVAVFAAANAKTDVPITSSALTAPVGAIATLLVLYRLIDPVGGLDREVGLYLGLLAAGWITYGSWRSTRDERTRDG